jgi:hypothetical protein
LRSFKLSNDTFKRKGNFRKQNKAILIIAEKTEKIYFENFKKLKRGVNVEIRKDSGSDPITLIKFSNRIKEEYDVDRVYCVYDVDSTDEGALIEAQNLASEFGISTCISNPCFEIWFLLHFQYSTASLDSYSDVKRELLKYLADYDKNKNVYDKLQLLQAKAIRHAKQLEEHHKQECITSIRRCNPSTQIYVIVDYLNK